MQTAILAAGCFWGVKELIHALPGVIETKVGYTGGDVLKCYHRNHGSHAEGIKVTFDENVLSYRTLLEFFFQIHNPTTLTGREMISICLIVRLSFISMRSNSKPLLHSSGN